MLIKNTLESFSINTSDAKLYCEIKELMLKNFKNTLQSKGKVISFYNENELVQRKYFLKLIKRLYTKNSGDISELKFLEYKTFKLSYVTQNTLSHLLFIDIDFFGEYIYFYLNDAPRIFSNYLTQIFKDNIGKYDSEENMLKIKISSQSDFSTLSGLFAKKQHLRFSVVFRYSKIQLQKCRQDFENKNSSKFTKRFSALASLLESEFEILGCNKDSNFEDVRENYLTLVKIYHPDLHMQESESAKLKYRQKFERIQKAYESLKPLFRNQENFINA